MTTDLKKVAAEAGDVYADVIQSLKKASQHLGDDAGDALSKSTAALLKSASELAEQAREKSKETVKKVGEEVREHPAATAAIIAAAVALIGVALHQRKAHH